MILQLDLPPDFSPTVQFYARTTNEPVGDEIAGTADLLRPTLYDFDISDIAAGDYVVDVNQPYGRIKLRKTETSYYLTEEWWQIDAATQGSTDPGKVFVDENYGGDGHLIYELSGIPVYDASIEVYLYSDYVANRKDGTYRLATSRQNVSGEWAVPFYLDPAIYVFRFYKAGVAGPDAYRIVVSFDVDEIEVTQIDPVQIPQNGLPAQLRIIA